MDEFKEQIFTLRTALAGLVGRLDRVHADSRYKVVWESFADQGRYYNELTYTAELETARTVLESTPRIVPEFTTMLVTDQKSVKFARSGMCPACEEDVLSIDKFCRECGQGLRWD